MPNVNLSRMTVEALMDLRKRVDETLHQRRAELQRQLERMGVVDHIARIVQGAGPPIPTSASVSGRFGLSAAACCARRERPRCCRAAEQCNELASFHSITLSARSTRAAGTSWSITFAA